MIINDVYVLRGRKAASSLFLSPFISDTRGFTIPVLPFVINAQLRCSLDTRDFETKESDVTFEVSIMFGYACKASDGACPFGNFDSHNFNHETLLQTNNLDTSISRK